jgi:hypothetical protein
MFRMKLKFNDDASHMFDIWKKCQNCKKYEKCEYQFKLTKDNCKDYESIS